MTNSNKLPAYRWVIEILLVLSLISQAVIWLAPAPLLEPIVKGLSISLGKFGLIISIIALCIAIFSFAAAIIAARLGALRTFLLGFWILAAAALASGYTASYAALLLCRVFEGVGFGIMIAPPGTLVTQWFGEHEWAYINTANGLCSYIGMSLVFRFTVPLFYSLGTWQAVMRLYGIIAIAAALLWTIFGRERRLETAAAEVHAPAESGASPLEVIRMKPVLLCSLAFFGAMWVFQLYTTFLPGFFQSYRGMSMADASGLTSVLTIAGTFGAVAGGILTIATGLRKPFLWPVMTLMLIGCLGSVALTSTAAIRVALVLFGIGASAHLSAMMTVLMEAPGMTPAKVGTGFALVFSFGYAGAFFSPVVGGALAAVIGLQTVMIAFLLVQLIAIFGFMALEETGPARAALKVAPQPAQAS